MFKEEDLAIICCPVCKSDLVMDEEKLTCRKCNTVFPIINGIPRLLYYGKNSGTVYNEMWDYKWTVLDQGKGYNFRIIDANDPAYEIHNVFRFNEYEGESFKELKNGIAIDVGCGIGQYSVKLLEKGAKRVYSIDLTRGVDIGKKIFEEKFPELKEKVVFIQANARFLPIKSNSIDLGMALASLHHTGYLEECIEELIRTVKENNRFVVWIYAKPLLPISDKDRNLLGLKRLVFFMYRTLQIELFFNITKRLPNNLLVSILKFFASDTYYYLLHFPVIGKFIEIFSIPVNEYPDKGYRLINLYDAYSPTFSEQSDESDIIRWSKKFNFEILGFCPWRLGFLGLKKVKN